MKYIIIIFTIFFSFSSLSANLYNYKILRVIDGDTVEIEAKYLPKELKGVLKLRIKGIDAPEKGSRSKCELEDKLSLNAKLYLEQKISNGKDIKVRVDGWDKYGGRILGDIYIDGEFVSVKMIKGGYAVAYNGKGIKNNWCIRR